MNSNKKSTSTTGGFSKTERLLLEKFKDDLDQIRTNFLNESEEIIKASKQSATGKSSEQALARWNSSPLHALSQESFYIKSDNVYELLGSPEFLRLKKMFNAIDPSDESPAVQAAIESFLATVFELENWVEEKLALEKLGSIQSLLGPVDPDANAIKKRDAQVAAFQAECHQLVEKFKNDVEELFSTMDALSKSINHQQQAIRQLDEEAKKIDDHAEYERKRVVILSKQATLSKVKSTLFSSKFFTFYAAYRNKLPESSILHVVRQSDLYNHLRNIFDENNPHQEAPVIQNAVMKIKEGMDAMEEKLQNRLYSAAFPEENYSPPNLR